MTQTHHKEVVKEDQEDQKDLEQEETLSTLKILLDWTPRMETLKDGAALAMILPQFTLTR